MASQYNDVLCTVTDHDECLAMCEELLVTDLSQEDRQEILHFKAHHLRAKERFAAALLVCSEVFALALSLLNRGFFLEIQAAALMELGRIREALAALAELDYLELPADEPKVQAIRAYAQMTRGLIAVRSRDLDAYDYFAAAGRMFEGQNNVYGVSWVHLCQADFAILLGELDRARDCVSRVIYPKLAMVGRLLEAEIEAVAGRWDLVDAMIRSTLADYQAVLQPRHHARIYYLQALKQRAMGHFVHAGVLTNRALDELAEEERQEFRLFKALLLLRSEISEREVA